MRCLETRKYVLSTATVKWRRYKDDDGVSTTTCEVPTELWNRLVTACGETELVVTRTSASDSAAKRGKAFELIDEGWKPAAIAHELGLNEGTVTKYKRKRKQNGML